MSLAFILFLGILLIVTIAIGSFLLQLVSRAFKVQGVTYGRAVLVLITYSIISGAFKEAAVLVAEFSVILNIIGFIVAITFSYNIYKKGVSITIGKFILIGITTTIIGIIVGLIIVIPIRLYVLTPFTVIGSAMAPTYSSGDYLIIEEWNKSVNKGDVVVATIPVQGGGQQYAISRVTGVPGDTVNGMTVSNGEYYLSKDSSTATSTGLVSASAIIGKPLFNLGH